MVSKIALFIIILLSSTISAMGQFSLSPNGVLVDSVSGKDYIIIEKTGTQKELYEGLKQSLFLKMADPQKSISTVENNMISLRIHTEGTTKYAGLNGKVGITMALKFQFKDNRIRISGAWTETSWMGNNVDVYVFLAKGGLRIFNTKGEIKNIKRLREYNKITNDLINSLLFEPEIEDW